MRLRLHALLLTTALALALAQPLAAAGGRGRTPATRTSAKKLSPAARSVMVEHARALGVQTSNRAAASPRLRQTILAKEIERAGRADSRNSPKLVRAIMRRFGRAQNLRPKKQRVLLGFTRMIDAKATLDSRFFAQATTALARGGTKAQLLKMIDVGPKTNGKLMETPEQLIASVVRHQLTGEGASLQLHITPKIAEWLDQQMKTSGTRAQRAVGGAAAFGANLASAFSELDVTFHTPGEISSEQAAGFSSRVKLISGKSGSQRVSAGKASTPSAPTKVNYILETPPNLSYTIFGQSKIRVDGKMRDTTVPSRGRIILSTQASHPPTFDPRLDDAALGRIAKAHDTFVAVGVHYLTAKPIAQLNQEGHLLKRQLQVMKKANPELLVHYQYVSPKNPRNEWRAFRSVQGVIDSMSLNTVELRALAKNLNGKLIDRKRGPVKLKISRAKGRDADEDPVHAFELGRQLMDALGLKRLHLHGLHADVILVRGANKAQMQREGLAALKGRQLGVNKGAAATGEIRSSKDIFQVLPSFEPASIGALRKMADYLVRKGELANQHSDGFMVEGAHVMRDGVGISVTPVRKIHSFRGGLVSLGDTLDLTTLFHAR